MLKSIFFLYVGFCVVFLPAQGIAQSSTPTLDAEQAAFLTLINNYRVQNGAAPLRVSIALQNSSQWMSADMASKNYFSHTDSLGRNPFTRMAAFGYSHSLAGENIAAGNSDAQNTLGQWQTACDPNASGVCTYAHRQNMLNRSYKVIGIGRAYNAASPYRWYWTTDFGGYVDQTLGSNPPATSAPVISFFKATPATIFAGQPTTLSWNVSGATSLSIDNGIGNVTLLLSKSVTPTMTTKYTLTAKGAGGTTTATATVTVNPGTPPQQPVGISIWPSTSAPTMYLNAGAAIEVGLKFRSDAAGKITGIRFYKASFNTGVHTGTLWAADGRLLATGTFVNETASGWQTLKFTSPVTISANTTYIASYHTNSGLPSVGLELQSRSQDNPPLHALQSGTDGLNGVYTFGGGGNFPSQVTSGYNFWVDVIFTP